MKWDMEAPLVYTACLDGVVRMWDARNGKCCAEWSGHQDALLDFDVSRWEKNFRFYKTEQ